MFVVVVCSFSRRDCRHLLSPRSPFAPVRPFGLTPRLRPRSKSVQHTYHCDMRHADLAWPGRRGIAEPKMTHKILLWGDTKASIWIAGTPRATSASSSG